jgi:transposase
MDELTTSSVPSDDIEFAAFVAIDWADQEHAWALAVAGSGKRERGKLAQKPEEIEAWASSLAARFQNRPIAVALEQARGALVYGLSKYEHLVLFPIHPSTSAKYREAIYPSGAKDDPKDADLLLDFLLWHRDRLRRLQPDDAQTRQLRVLVERRRQLVDEKTATTNRIIDQLKLYFPQVLDWFDKMDAPMVEAFLTRWPTLALLQTAASEQILEFFHRHNSRSQSRNQERLEQIAKARPLTTDSAVIEPAVLVVETLLKLVNVLRAGIEKLEQAIANLFAQHPDAALFQSFPGAGEVLAPRLLAAFGSQRERFASANELQSYSGIAPVISRSGNSEWIHFRWACPKFLRQSFHEYAASSMKFCDWARAFYDKQTKKGKSRHAALRSLAFKWIRIMYRCWVDRLPYDEKRHLTSIAQPAEAATESAPCESPEQYVWKNQAGFWKFSAVDA